METLMEQITLNQPLYLYKSPMFAITVSAVLIVENGVIVVKKDNIISFPMGFVKAGQESLQFSMVRNIKEQTGLMVSKNSLMPVDFRSDPERSKEHNIIDLGFMAILDKTPEEILKNSSDGVKWLPVDMELNCLEEPKKLYMDHDVLLKRAMEIIMIMKS